MNPVLLDEKILAVERALARADVPHAFGGALALAYYATPRATVDIDLNVFVPADEADDDMDGWMICAGDCDDGEAAANPGLAESADLDNCGDGIDNDCDSLVDVDPECGGCFVKVVNETFRRGIHPWLPRKKGQTHRSAPTSILSQHHDIFRRGEPAL